MDAVNWHRNSGWRRLAAWLQQRRRARAGRRPAVIELSTMSDHLLRDLGFGRDQVDRLRRRNNDENQLFRWRWRRQDI